jgi:hypothetical protein
MNKEMNMNKKIFTQLSLLMIIGSLVLAGCSSQAITSVAASSGLSTATKLAAGTLKLQGSSNAVTASQAPELLTLWQAYQLMSSSDTTSQAELDALVRQIQSSMSSTQLQAIDDLGLTELSVTEVVQSAAASGATSQPQSSASSSANASQGVPSGSSSASQGAPSGSTNSQAGGSTGGMPSGNMAGGPGGDSIMSTINGSGTSVQGTAAATQFASNTASSQVSPMVLQAVIQMLMSLSQTSG